MGDTATNNVTYINNNKTVIIRPPLSPLSRNVSVLSEHIAKYIINKVISLAITKHNNAHVEHEVTQHCFAFTKRTINTIIMSQYICFDKDEAHADDTPRNHTDINGMFYNNCHCGVNNWENTIEPSSTDVDSYASSMAKTTTMNGSNNKHNDETKRNTLIPKRDSRILGTVYRSNNSENAAEGRAKKKKGWFEIMNEMSVHDIAWEDNEDQIRQDNEFEELRREKENEIRLKEYEMKMKVKEEKAIQIKKKEEVNKQNKYKNKKITIDANGNVIIIKPVDMNILEKDFISIRSNSKNIKRVQPPSAVALHKQSKRQLPTIETAPSSLHPFPEKKVERVPVVPSGSCFDKMKPEIGVCITEDKRYKTGGKDFFKKFNKYSLDNYTKELQSTLSANMTYTANSNNNNTNLAFTHSNNYMTNSDFHNRTLTDTNNYNTIIGSSFLKKNLLSKTSTKMNNSAYTPLIKLSSTTNQFNLKCTLDDLNLVTEHDETAYAHMQPSINMTNIFKPSTLSSSSRNHNNNVLPLTDMTTFTSSLLNRTAYPGKQPSNTSPSLNYAMKPSKPKRTAIEREIGKSALTTHKRLPRMRHMIMANTFHNT